MIVDIQHQEHRDSVMFAAGVELTVDGLESTVRKMALFSKATDFYFISTLQDLPQTDVGEICVVLIDGSVRSPIAQAQLKLQIDRIRHAHHKTVFVIAAIVENNSALDDLVVAGCDLLLDRNCQALWSANLYSMVRALRVVVRPNQPKFVSRDQDSISLGAWSFKPRRQIGILPNGDEVQLQQAEWEYLRYLIHRDHNGQNIPDNVEQDIGRAPHRKALVYKIKQKLGENFPIKFSKEHGYFLEPVVKSK